MSSFRSSAKAAPPSPIFQWQVHFKGCCTHSAHFLCDRFHFPQWSQKESFNLVVQCVPHTPNWLIICSLTEQQDPGSAGLLGINGHPRHVIHSISFIHSKQQIIKTLKMNSRHTQYIYGNSFTQLKDLQLRKQVLCCKHTCQSDQPGPQLFSSGSSTDQPGLCSLPSWHCSMPEWLLRTQVVDTESYSGT